MTLSDCFYYYILLVIKTKYSNVYNTKVIYYFYYTELFLRLLSQTCQSCRIFIFLVNLIFYNIKSVATVLR